MKYIMMLLFLVSCASHNHEPNSETEVSCVMKVKRYGPNKKEVCVKQPSRVNRLGPNKW